MANYSKQRKRIIDIIKNMDNYPNAEEIYISVKKDDSSISRSTVYRNLNSLVKNGIISQILVSNGPVRYDYIEGKSNIGYIECIMCNKIFEFQYDYNSTKNELFKKTGVEILENGIIIKGICETCKNLKFREV